jgi:hypothetical protein
MGIRRRCPIVVRVVGLLSKVFAVGLATGSRALKSKEDKK